MIKNKEIYTKYKDIIDENNKPEWRSRPDEELVYFQILLNDNPSLGFYSIYNKLYKGSYQIQWIPYYFWEKNLNILEKGVYDHDDDTLNIFKWIIEWFLDPSRQFSNKQISKSFLDSIKKLNDYYKLKNIGKYNRIRDFSSKYNYNNNNNKFFKEKEPTINPNLRARSKKFTEKKVAEFNRLKKYYFLTSNFISNKSKEEIYKLYGLDIINDFERDVNLREFRYYMYDYEIYEDLIDFANNNQQFLNYCKNLLKDNNKINLAHVLLLVDSGGFFGQYKELLLELFKYSKKDNLNSIILTTIMISRLTSKLDIAMLDGYEELIEKYSYLVLNKKISLDLCVSYIANPTNNLSQKEIENIKNFGIDRNFFFEDLEGLSNYGRSIIYNYINNKPIDTDTLKIISKSRPDSDIYFTKDFPEWNLKLVNELKKKNKIDSFVEELFNYLENNNTRNQLTNFSNEIISELLRISLLERSTFHLANLINGKKGRDAKSLLNKKSTNIAHKLIEEELKRGDPVAMECLHKLILDRNHTKKMLNILVYHAGWGSEQAAEVISKLLTIGKSGNINLGKRELDREISDFLFNHLNLKNIKESGQLNERFILFKKIYPRFFYKTQSVGFNYLSDSSKFKLYTALVNNRKFRNSNDAQRNIFLGLNTVFLFDNTKFKASQSNSLLHSLDIIISKENVGSNQLSNYLNKVLRILKTLTYLPSFSKNISEIKTNIEKCKDLEETYNFLNKIFKEIIKTDLKSLSNQEIEDLAKQDDLVKKAIRLNNHYSNLSEDHKNIYIEGLKHFLKSPLHHSDFRYKDLNILLEKYQGTTNLNKTLISKWIKTMKYVRYPESTKNIDVKSIVNRIKEIKISLKGQRISNEKFNSISSLLEKLEPILYKLNSKDIQKRNEVVKNLRDIKIELKNSKDLHLINIIDSILTDILSISSNQYLVTDEFNFKEAHDIGERWGSCQSWSSSGRQNLGLVATINDGTKKYVILKDKVTGGWNARGIIHLALRGNEFVLALDNYRYNSHPEQEKFVREFAINKAKYLKINFIDSVNSNQEEKNNLIIFGKSPSFYSDNGLTSTGMALKNQVNVNSL